MKKVEGNDELMCGIKRMPVCPWFQLRERDWNRLKWLEQQRRGWLLMRGEALQRSALRTSSVHSTSIPFCSRAPSFSRAACLSAHSIQFVSSQNSAAGRAFRSWRRDARARTVAAPKRCLVPHRARNAIWASMFHWAKWKKRMGANSSSKRPVFDEKEDGEYNAANLNSFIKHNTFILVHKKKTHVRSMALPVVGCLLYFRKANGLIITCMLIPSIYLTCRMHFTHCFTRCCLKIYPWQGVETLNTLQSG